MPDSNDTPPASESRPVDLGLSEGKSMGFSPTSALAPDSFPIGGLAPIQAAPTNSPAPATPQASAADSAPSGGAPSSGESS